MTVFHAIVLSVVEGVTEFLPVSSTGHLILASKLLGVAQTDFATSFELFIQLGAVASIVTMYLRKLTHSALVLKRVVIAFVPAALLGFAFYPFIKSALLGNALVTAWALVLGGLLLIAVELLYKEANGRTHAMETMSANQACAIGFFQLLSFVPGVSRAAATIIGGLLVGLKRKTAVEFSFLLAIPTILAATGWDLMKSSCAFSAFEWALLIIGFIGSWITATVIVKEFLKFIKTRSFIPFGIYRIAAGIFFWIILMR